MSAPTWAEDDRLAALDSYQIMDTAAEADFDDLARVAAQICNVPMALISLVDDRRQWFKAAIGLGAPETPREVAFCAHAIQETGLFVVEDATKDSRFADNPLVTEDPSLRFYTGAPLTTLEGFPLGTLCVLDTKPGRLNETQRFALETLARQVVLQLELRRALIEQRRTADLRMLLVQELQHRVKNTLTTVQSVVSQSLRTASSLEAGRAAVTDRLVAMGRAHDIFSAGNLHSARLADVIKAATNTGGVDERRYSVGGPAVVLKARAALGMAMALHELNTNAIKFGALTNSTGRIELNWMDDGETLTIVWREVGGPPVTPPSRKGFGSRMIVSALSGEAGGESRVDYRPDGLVWTFVARLADIANVGLADDPLAPVGDGG